MAALNVVCGVVLGGAWLLAPSVSTPYLAEVARNVQNPADLALYCAFLCLFAVGREVLGRGVAQRLVAGRFGVVAGVIVGTLVVSAVHLRYGVIAAAYGASTALVGSIFYARTRELRTLLVWHVQWDLAAVAAVCVLAMALPGAARTELLFVYKGQQVERGKLVHSPEHGWIDTLHADPKELATVAAALERGDAAVSIRTGFSTAWGGVREVERTYEVDTAGATPDEIQHLACALFLDHAVAVEEAQERLPFWLGTQVSAFQPDDLPGNALACQGWSGGAADRDRWAREGRGFVARQVRSVPLEAAWKARVAAVRHRWARAGPAARPTAAGVVSSRPPSW